MKNHDAAYLLFVALTLLVHGATASNHASINTSDQQRFTGEETKVHKPPRTVWPYGDAPEGVGMQDSSLGQLCKVSDRVIVGQVQDVATVSTNSLASTEDPFLNLEASEGLLWQLTVKPEQELIGVKQSRMAVAWLPVIRSVKSVPKTGDRVVVFISTNSIYYLPHEVRDWDFDRVGAEARGKKWKRDVVAGYDRGLLTLTKEDGEETVRIIQGYMTHLRGSKRDRYSYFDFLHGLLSNRNERVRLDARVDILNLVRNLSKEEIRKVVETSTVDAQVKDYSRQILEFREEKTGAQQ
jgi:hypothetical protein